VLLQQDKLLEAVGRFEESFKIYAAWYGEGDVHLASNHMSTGRIFGMMGMYENAQEQFGKALELYRTQHETTDDWQREMHISMCLCSIGSIDWETKNFESAKENYTKALEIERCLVSVHPGLYDRTGDTLMCMVDLLVLEDKLDEALRHIKEALPLLRHVHGQRSATTAKALMRLGDIYRKQGEFDLSLKAFKKARKF
jgi:tetratricopeptide (TPR) repeat protein